MQKKENNFPHNLIHISLRQRLILADCLSNSAYGKALSNCLPGYLEILYSCLALPFFFLKFCIQSGNGCLYCERFLKTKVSIQDSVPLGFGVHRLFVK